MKKTILNLLIITSILLVSCEKEETKIPVSNSKTNSLIINFNNTVDGVPINSVSYQYTNAAKNKYSVNLLKYYVTNVVLVSENNEEFFAKNYNLIDMDRPEQNTFTLLNVPCTKYTKMKFILGVDSLRNNSGVQDGFLDPSFGMLWTWNTGYIFFKHEGNYIDSLNKSKPLRFHLGTSPARGFVEFLLPLVEINSSSTKKLTVNFDLNKAYSAKTLIDFNIDNDRQSESAADVFWIANLKTNLEQSFSFGKVE
jgi:hypothetical protein